MREESEKKGFTFPRTKHSLAPLVLSSLPSFSSRSRALFSIRSSFFFTFFPTPFSVFLFFLLEQYSFLSSFLTCSPFSLSLFFFYFTSYSSSSRSIAICSLPRKLVHSSSSLACSFFLPSLFSVSLFFLSVNQTGRSTFPSLPLRHRDL